MSQTTTMNSGLYKITNLSNGKVYVGSSFNLKKRLYEHLRALKRGTHRNQHLQSAFNVAADAFRFEVVMFAAGKQYVLDMERALILAYNSHVRDFGYNKSTETHANLLGFKHDAAYSEGVSKRKRGNTYRLGAVIPQEMRDRISAKLKGRSLSDETRKKMSDARKGKKHSPEHTAARIASVQAAKLAKRNAIQKDTA